jgi:CheY-like chemotaxis protein
MMPEMNGWQFLERARADSILDSIPVVIMTARRKSVDLLPAPSKEVLHKPFDTSQLLSAIARYAAAS